jgi:hypothetical protein
LLSLADTRGRADHDESLRPSGALLGGYGMEAFKNAVGGLSAYGVGLGVRAGVTLVPVHRYLGGMFVFHFGSSAEAENTTGTTVYRAAYHAMYGGPEIGRDFDLGRVLLRPYLGAGELAVLGSTDVRQRVSRDDRVQPYVAAGLLGALRFGSWSFGADAHASLPVDDGWFAWVPTLFVLVGRSAE